MNESIFLYDMKENINSPLKLFVLAKKEITDIFSRLLAYVDDNEIYIKDIESLNKDIVDENYVKLIQENKDKIRNILDILGRNHMKVAFFGRTSNGKSTVINAMLGEKVLPSGIGHTTNCFVQVEGIGNADNLNQNDEVPLEPYIYTEGEINNDVQNFEHRKSINNVEQLANALTSEKLSHDSLVHVCWPTNRCPLLRDDVILVDSPGIDVSPDVDQWIDKHCQDADVFILVANSESTLMQTEKNFFHKVASKLSGPNIFVLNNRWDASSAFDPEIVQRVINQHTERVVQFLTNELKVMSESETRDRIFFVSAKEVLQTRLALPRGGAYSPQLQLSDAKTKARRPDENAGAEARLAEFKRFEARFEECISRSALQTKFGKHSHQALSICSAIRSAFEASINSISGERDLLVARSVKTTQSIKLVDTGLKERASKFEARLAQLRESVRFQVSQALEAETRRLGALVDEFVWSGPGSAFASTASSHYNSGDAVLVRYKRELEAFVEEGLSRNLSSRCLADTLEDLQGFKRDLTASFGQIFPISKPMEKNDFKRGAVDLNIDEDLLSPDTVAMLRTAFHLECQDLWEDFKEHLQFRFSLSPARLVKRLLIPLIQGSKKPITARRKDHFLYSFTSPDSKSESVTKLTERDKIVFDTNRLARGDAISSSYFPDKVTTGANTPNVESVAFDYNGAPSQSKTRFSLPDIADTGSLVSHRSKSHLPQSSTFDVLYDDETANSEEDTLVFSDELRHLSTIASASLFGVSSAGTGFLGAFLVARFLLLSPSSTFSTSSLAFKISFTLGCLYGLAYLYERASWTPLARERVFKRQFSSHGGARLRRIASRAASNCASHVSCDARHSLSRLLSSASAFRKSLEVAARTDTLRREACDKLLADICPRVEAVGLKLTRALDIFLTTYFANP